MNEAPDYSAAYVVLRTGGGSPGAADAPEGQGFTVTIGRGNELAAHAARLIGQRAVGLSIEEIVSDLGGFSRHLLGDSQLRWLGPDKGALHLGAAAVITPAGTWPPLAGSRCGLLADMSPRQIVDLSTGLPEGASPPRRAGAARVQGRRPRRAEAHVAGTATPPTPPARDGSATTTPSSPGCAVRPSSRAGTRSSSRSAPISPTTCAVAASRSAAPWTTASSIRRPPARALPRPRAHAGRVLHGAEAPGYSARIRQETLEAHRFPDGRSGPVQVTS